MQGGNRLDTKQRMEELTLLALNAIRTGAEWLSAEELVSRFPAVHSTESLSMLVNEDRVFYVELDGKRVFAAYQFDQCGEPLGVIAAIVALWRGRKSVALAGWLESTTGFLAGRRPRELLDIDPEAVLSAALDHLAGPNV